MNNVDIQLFQKINSEWTSKALNLTMPIFSQANKNPIFWILILSITTALLVYGGRKAKIYLVTVLLSIVTSNLLCDLFKHNIKVFRPEDAHTGKVHLLIGSLHSHGFPSAHSSNMMALAILTVLFYGRRTLPIFLLPLLTGYSRIYCGLHFPSQVLGGWLLGALVGILGAYAASKVITPRPTSKQQ